MLVVFGAINLDIVFPVDKLPGTSVPVRSPGGWTEPGGQAVNQAIAAARDGAQVELVGAVGDDPLADAVLSALAPSGIGLRRVKRGGGATGRATITVEPDGHTTILVDPGINGRAAADLVPDALLGPRHTLLLQTETEPAEIAQLIARARRRGTRVVLHLSPPRPVPADALRQVDVLMGSVVELAWLGEHLGTGNNPASLQAALGPVVVGMSGVQGAELVSAREYLRMAAHPVRMRDTTAAADCFVGVFAAALDRDARLAEALRRAAVAAALAVTTVGTGRSMPDEAAIEEALREAPAVRTTQAEIQD